MAFDAAGTRTMIAGAGTEQTEQKAETVDSRRSFLLPACRFSRFRYGATPVSFSSLRHFVTGTGRHGSGQPFHDPDLALDGLA
jgi:hypothetical protein